MKANELEIILTAIHEEIKQQQSAQSDLLESNRLITNRMDQLVEDFKFVANKLSSSKEPAITEITTVPVPIVPQAELVKLNKLLNANLHVALNPKPQEVVHKHVITQWKGITIFLGILLIACFYAYKYYGLELRSKATAEKYGWVSKVSPIWTHFLDSAYEADPGSLRTYIESLPAKNNTTSKTKSKTKKGR